MVACLDTSLVEAGGDLMYTHIVANDSQELGHIPNSDKQLYTQFIDCRLVDLRFVYTLNTKISYSRLTNSQTLKLNVKTGRLCSPERP